MKYRITLFFLFFFGLCIFISKGNAQCIANAGNDMHLCKIEGFEMTLGGEPTAIGGQLPYTYEWTIDPIELTGGLTFYASTFLDDTSSASPELLDTWGDEMFFFIRVEDGNGSVCRDTVKITVSEFGISAVTYLFYLNEGDSVQLNPPNVYTTLPLDSVSWHPSIGLTDPTSLQPWAKPGQDVVYGSTVWDSAGCMVDGDPFQYVFVEHVSTRTEPSSRISQFYVHPTLLNGLVPLTIEKPDSFTEYTAIIYDHQGKIVLSGTYIQQVAHVDLGFLKAGSYYYTILSNGSSVATGKFLLQH